jgi:FKBP-type peptidyl-prolyl cis-trans isomerase
MKKLDNFFLTLLGSIFFLSSCQTSSEGEFQEGKTGLLYQYIKEGSGATCENGQVMLLNMVYTTEDDSTLFSTAQMGAPVPIEYNDSIAAQMGGLGEGFGMLKEGDSVRFKLKAEEVFENTFRQPLPPFIDKESFITFNIGVADIMSQEELQAYQTEQMQKQREAMMAQQQEQMQEDIVIIDQYLEENNIDADSTESGLRYVITENGSGTEPSPGDSVYVHYRGTLLDGTPFDASYDRGEPYAFPLGQGWVIPGWDEGIGLLKKGAKATLYIPSPLAYGPQARSEVIKANSILIFDVELVDVVSNN